MSIIDYSSYSKFQFCQLYSDLRKRGFPAGYQVLCANCNWSKRLKGKCAHCR